MSDPRSSNRKAVFTVIEREGHASRWVRIGIAFINRDASINILLDALPVNGTLHVRDFPPADEQEAGSPSRAAEPAATPARKPRTAVAAA